MTVEELIGEVWGLLEAWGPIALVVFGVFFLIVFGLVVAVFVKVGREMSKMSRRQKARRLGRW